MSGNDMRAVTAHSIKQRMRKSHHQGSSHARSLSGGKGNQCAQVADLSRLSMSTTSSSLIEPEDVVDVTISSGLEEAGRITPTPSSGW